MKDLKINMLTCLERELSQLESKFSLKNSTDISEFIHETFKDFLIV